ncbi:hypothetical protein J6590_104630, partial [Homalodisca vitripennis]
MRLGDVIQKDLSRSNKELEDRGEVAEGVNRTYGDRLTNEVTPNRAPTKKGA